MTSESAAAGNTEARGPGLPEHGQPAYLQLPALDVERSAAFYSALFGWRAEPGAAGFEAPGLIGQWVTDRPPAGTSGPVLWIWVDRIEDTLALVPRHGGQVVAPPSDDGPRRLATVRDPGGTELGIVAGRHAGQPADG